MEKITKLLILLSQYENQFSAHQIYDYILRQLLSILLIFVFLLIINN